MSVTMDRGKEAEQILEGLQGRLVSKSTFDRQVEITQQLIQDLHQEIDTQRLVARYTRRQYHQVLFWVALFTMHLREIALRYDGIWFSPLFFLTSHGGPQALEVPLRVAGALAQVLALTWFFRRTQVPAWLLDRLTGGAISVEDYEHKYGIRLRADRRQNQRLHRGPERRKPE